MKETLAKLTPPQLSDIYHRERLYRLLDSARSKPIIWITSPAGSGKTTLISSYLKKKKLIPLWYQIDQDDTDLALFFSYLAQVAKHHMAEAEPLPILTAEYLAGISTFSRNYFRKLFGNIKSSNIIVFDDYQEVSPMSMLHKVLMVGLSEIPQDLNVIIISRENPPAEYIRMQTNGRIKHIQWGDIQLDSNETEGICQLRLNNESVSSSYWPKIHAQAQGWVAGLILMLENISPPNVTSINTQENQQNIFDYFAAEIMSKESSVTQQLLLKTALLPKVSVENAIALSNIPNAESILKILTQRNYFTVYLTGETPTYEYHPLFKKYLLAQGKNIFSKSELLNLNLQASHLLEESGHTRDSIKILLELNQWQKSIELILKYAKSLIQKGQEKTLLSWLEKIPSEIIEVNSWLNYWKGMCYISFDPSSSRSHLEKAFYIFKAETDVTGQLLCFCSIVDTYTYERTEMISVDKWLKEVEPLISTVKNFTNNELGIRLTCAMFMVLIYRKPDHSNIEMWEKRACEIVLSDADPRLRISIGNHLVLYFMWWKSNQAKTQVIVNALQPIIKPGKVPALALVTWKMIEAGYHWMVSGNDESILSAQKGLDIADENGLHMLDVYILTQAVFSGLSLRDNKIVEHYLNKMTPLIEMHRHMDTSWYYFLYAWAEIAKENYELAFCYSELALEHSLKSGRPFMIASAFIEQGVLLFRQGKKIKARNYVDEALDIGKGMRSPTLIHLAEFAKMEFEIITNGDKADSKQIQKCLMLSKEVGELSVSWFSPKTLVTFYSLALNLGFDKDYVIERIQKAKLFPLDNTPVNVDWPYPIKIYTLGTFKIIIDGVQLSFTGKAQKKVLELLKALIAYGGYHVNIEALCEALWPDADGDAAYQAFTMTLKRLRKLLNNKECLLLSNAKLSLNPKHVWLDMWLFEDGLNDSDIKVKENSFSLYKGDFLENEPEVEWLLPIRNRLRQKYLLHEIGVDENKVKSKATSFSLKVVSND